MIPDLRKSIDWSAGFVTPRQPMNPQLADRFLKLTDRPIDVVRIHFDFPHHAEIEILGPETS